MRISMIGAGHVGLVSGVCLATHGHQVVCVDADPAKVEMINQGMAPFHEPGLGELLTKSVGVNLSATTDLPDAVAATDVSIIAVGTPLEGSAISLRAISEAAGQIGDALSEKSSYHVVVVKSTVVPGTTGDVVMPILATRARKRPGEDFGLAMNPEFLRQGEAVEDFLNPDRIVLGGIDERSIAVLREIYAPFPGDRIETTARTAEMIKYASNSLLATLISFSNEVANLCSALGGVDIVDVLRAVHGDRRLSPILPGHGRITPAFTSYLEAGCGFGGSCLPKDVQALRAHAKRAGVNMRLLEAVLAVNAEQPSRVIGLLRKHFAQLPGVRVAVLGLAFKPGTDDMRESPAIPVVQDLLREGCHVTAYDPAALPEARRIFGRSSAVVLAGTLEQCIAGADALVIMTRWEEFKAVPRLVARCTPPPLVVDGRRLINKNAVPRYEGIGLGVGAGLAWLQAHTSTFMELLDGALIA
jgi:UDPglucose 6-dehydrogenase